MDAVKNFAYSLVATAPSPASSGTSLIVTAGQGSLFPAPPFNVTIWPTALQPLASNAEIVTVIGISTDTFTIVRARENTSARTVVVGDQIAATITAKALTDTQSQAAPADDLQIQANCCEFVQRQLLIASGKKVSIGLGGHLRIM